MTNIVQNAEAVLERLVDPILGVDFKTAKMIRAVDLQADGMLNVTLRLGYPARVEGGKRAAEAEAALSAAGIKAVVKVEQEIIADDSSDYREKLRKFIERYYRFLQQNPTYVRMVMWENLNHAEYFIEGEVYTTKDPILSALERIYEDACKDHKVLDSIDPKQLMITLIGVSFNYFSNNDTLSQIVREDLMDEDAVNRRIRSVTDMLLAYIEARG